MLALAALVVAGCAAAPTPHLDVVGYVVAGAGADIAGVAYRVDAVQQPVPVLGTPSCSRPGCR